MASFNYEQKFNALSDGDLNGQDSFTADAEFDVQTSIKYEGAKGLLIPTVDGATKTAIRSIDACVDGTVYCVMRFGAIAKNIVQFNLLQGASRKMEVGLIDGHIKMYGSGSFVTIKLSPAINTWYIIEIQWDDSAQDNKYRCRVYSDGAWGDWSSWLTVENTSYTEIDKIEIRTIDDGFAGCDNYFDTISLTDPTLPSAVGRSFGQIF